MLRITMENAMPVQQVANFFQTNMDFPRFARLTRALGKQVNNEQLRFMKAWIFEESIEEYSNQKIQYIGDEGCDLIIPALNNARVEMKYVEDALYTPSKKQLRESTGNIKLMNSLGTNTHKVLPTNYADYLIFIGQQGAILFDKATVSKYIKSGGDGINANIPISEGIIMATPDQMTGNGQTEVDFIQGLRNYIKLYIQGIK